MARKRTTPVEVLTETQQRRNKALEMRLAGLSQAEIARQTGWSKQNVSRYIKEAIADITRENAEEFLELELSRLDALWNGIWEDASHGDTWKIDRALAIMEQRAKLTGTYKAAELKAIAEAKGGVSAETTSMIGNFFGKLEELVAAETLSSRDENSEGDGGAADES